MSKIRCGTCRGQKKLIGIGGIEKDCPKCDGEGKIAIASKAVEKQEETQPVVVEPEALIPDVVVKAPDRPKRKSRAKASGAPVITLPIAPDVILESINESIEPIFSPYEDEFMRAILEELTMDPFAWADKYKHVTSLFGISKITNQPCELITKVQRANIRTDYAYSKPISPRTDNMSASQDAAAHKDGAYQNYVAQEKARADRALKAAMPKMNGVLEKGRATGIGGV